MIKKGIKIIGLILLIPLSYVLGVILYAMVTQYKPSKIEVLYENKKATTLPDSALTFLNWNIGYAGLGEESDFFYDGGKMVRPSKHLLLKNYEGIKQTIYQNEADFILLQEIDVESKRSYFLDEFKGLKEILNKHLAYFALNYNVRFVPIPFTEPMGKTYAGLATFSRFTPAKVYRYQFSGKFPFPTHLFQLTRCMLVCEYNIANGKKLVVINAHFSAYDETGKIKSAEMNDFKSVIAQYKKSGDYIIAGADWNQCPPGFKPNHFHPNVQDNANSVIANNFLDTTWSWKYDTICPTNRTLSTAFDKKLTYTTIIDFYLRSENIQVLGVKTIDQQFMYSDHQPVLLKAQLR